MHVMSGKVVLWPNVRSATTHRARFAAEMSVERFAAEIEKCKTIFFEAAEKELLADV